MGFNHFTATPAMMPFVRTFESNIFAMIAFYLFGRQFLHIFQAGGKISAAGCARYYGHNIQCDLIHSYSPAGFAALLTLILALLGLYGAWQMICGRRNGIKLLMILYALQIPIWATAKGVYYFPTGFNLYLLHQVKSLALGINFLALVFCFTAIGLLQNARRR